MKQTHPPQLGPKSPWPYAIIATFVVFVSALAAYVGFACSNDVELVTADYYQQEIEYEQQMERLKRTHSLGDQVRVVSEPGTKHLRLQIPATHVSTELEGKIQFYYPANGNEDRHFPLEVSSEGVQEFDLSTLERGFWRMKVRWTNAKEEYHYEQELQSFETQLALR